MNSNRSLILFSFIAGVVAVILLPLVQCNQPETAPYHKFLQTKEFQKLSRTDQLSKCASCHKQEFDNEAKGPHAHAYLSLTEHSDYVNSPAYDCDFYTTHVNKSFEHCLGCHTPQNIFQTLLFDSFNDPLRLAEKLLQESHPRPVTRQNEQVTGIDCMSCHFDGKQMVSLKHKFNADDTIASKQTLPQLVANNLNCYLCHADVVRNFSADIAIKRTGAALCVNCHMETDANNKRTHYFYWQHDAQDKFNPKPGQLMNDFSFTLAQDKKSGVITWDNKSIPHKISPGPEVVLFCEVLNKDSVVLGNKVIRINKKKEFDEEMYKPMGNNYHRGVLGDDVPLKGEKITYSVALKNAASAAVFKISLMHKSQYWFPDSLGKITTRKFYEVKH